MASFLLCLKSGVSRSTDAILADVDNILNSHREWHHNIQYGDKVTATYNASENEHAVFINFDTIHSSYRQILTPTNKNFFIYEIKYTLTQLNLDDIYYINEIETKIMPPTAEQDGFHHEHYAKYPSNIIKEKDTYDGLFIRICTLPEITLADDVIERRAMLFLEHLNVTDYATLELQGKRFGFYPAFLLDIEAQSIMVGFRCRPELELRALNVEVTQFFNTYLKDIFLLSFTWLL